MSAEKQYHFRLKIRIRLKFTNTSQNHFFRTFETLLSSGLQEDLLSLVDLARPHPSLDGILSVIPLTHEEGRPRDLGSKTNGRETIPYQYVSEDLARFFKSLPYKSWYWSMTILHPGAELPIHKDTYLGGDIENLTRIHWPLLTNINSKFRWFSEDRKEIIFETHLPVGLGYALNVATPHQVVNHGSQPRVHLLCNLDVPFALKETN